MSIPLGAAGRGRPSSSLTTSCRFWARATAKNKVRNLKSFLHPILVPNQWQMLLCKLLERAHVRIKRPSKNLSFLGLCHDASVVFDKGNGRPFSLNVAQSHTYRCYTITKGDQQHRSAGSRYNCNSRTIRAHASSTDLTKLLG